MNSQGRVRWEVAPVPGSLLWSVTRDGELQLRRFLKKRALEHARKACQLEYAWWCIKSELMVKNRRGQYTREGSTYGDDPPEILG